MTSSMMNAQPTNLFSVKASDSVLPLPGPQWQHGLESDHPDPVNTCVGLLDITQPAAPAVAPLGLHASDLMLTIQCTHMVLHWLAARGPHHLELWRRIAGPWHVITHAGSSLAPCVTMLRRR